jgi:tetratricopeptide (TPR) repeat protein
LSFSIFPKKAFIIFLAALLSKKSEPRYKYKRRPVMKNYRGIFSGTFGGFMKKNKPEKFFLPAVLFIVLLLFACSSKEVSEDTLLLYIRAAALYNEGKFNDAIVLLDGKENGGEIKNFIPAIVMRGKAHYFLGTLDEAENQFRRAIKLRPAQKEARLYLARVLQNKGDGKSAMMIVESLLADDPYDVRTLRLAAELTKNDEHGGKTASLSYLNRAVEAGSESAFVLLERARRNWINGKAEDALNDISGAKTLTGIDTPLYRVIDNLEKTIKQGVVNEK